MGLKRQNEDVLSPQVCWGRILMNSLHTWQFWGGAKEGSVSKRQKREENRAETTILILAASRFCVIARKKLQLSRKTREYNLVMKRPQKTN